MKWKLSLLLLIGLLQACATTSLPPITQDVQLEEDEKRLWARASEEQKLIERSGLIYEDKALEAYLTEIAQKLQPPETSGRLSFRVKVLKNPLLNAFIYPDGTIYVHTGILARMENEAQLATLLAHEMTHAVHRHLVKQFRNVKNQTAFLATLTVTTGGLGGIIGGITAIAAVTGYSREHETEADREGFKAMLRAGYDPEEAPKLFLHLKREIEEEKKSEPFFFGTHPRLEERLENYVELLKTEKTTSSLALKNAETYLEKIKQLLLDNARLDIRAGRFALAEATVEKHLRIKPDNPEAYSILGDIHRQKGGDVDRAKAKAHYQKAIALAPTFSEAYRGLGMVHYREGAIAEATAAFEKYLSLSPRASDRAYIEDYISRCREKGENR